MSTLTPRRYKAELKMKHTDKQIIAEQKKEITRLQKLLAKAEVKLQTEIAKVRAEESEKFLRKPPCITPEMDQEEASRIYNKMLNQPDD